MRTSPFDRPEPGEVCWWGRGFTLLELLVVITVIVILTAITVPAWQGFRARSVAASCAGNLRQIGMALGGYLQDHDQRFPEMVAARERIDDDEAALDTVLEPYAGSSQIFRCPGDTRKLYETTGTSYYWNSVLNDQRLASLSFLTVTEISRIPVAADKEGFHRRSGRSVNYLYADGRSERELRLFTD